jgi:molybdate transport system permease protein
VSRAGVAVAGRSVGVPGALYAPAAVGVALLVLPLAALAIRADWASVPAAITSPEALSALRLSLITAFVATGLALVLGVPLALVIARTSGRTARWLRAIVTLPMVLPPLVGGVALLYLLGRFGLLGSYLDLWFGVRIPFTLSAVIIAQTFVAMPFLVVSLEGALRTAGAGYEIVAATLGASRWTAFRRITLPLALPGLGAGSVLCFARALGEFGATALFAGNREGVTQTMPLAIYSAFNGGGIEQNTAVALSLLLMVVALLLLTLIRPWRTSLSAGVGT